MLMLDSETVPRTISIGRHFRNFLQLIGKRWSFVGFFGIEEGRGRVEKDRIISSIDGKGRRDNGQVVGVSRSRECSSKSFSTRKSALSLESRKFTSPRRYPELNGRVKERGRLFSPSFFSFFLSFSFFLLFLSLCRAIDFTRFPIFEPIAFSSRKTRFRFFLYPSLFLWCNEVSIDSKTIR